jgi:VIT1/CCC1 family predicted Fe2+/Mn2+ transporter
MGPMRSAYGAVGSAAAPTGAQLAYAVGDVSASIQFHQNKADEGHRTDGELIKSVVYGGLDGILTAFSIVCGAAGGQLAPTTVLVLGVSNIMADAFAMGVGDVVSTLAYNEHVMRERRREAWEFENYPEGEIEEMTELFEQRGLPRDKAETVIKTMAKYKEFFIDIMMIEELALKVPSPDDNPYKEGLVTFVSFLVFGLMPLLGYIAVPLIWPQVSSNSLFYVSCVLTMAVLFLLGTFKSRFSASTWLKCGLEFLTLGSAAALTAYFIGVFVNDIAQDLLNNVPAA